MKAAKTADAIADAIHKLERGTTVVGPGLQPWGTVALLAPALLDYVLAQQHEIPLAGMPAERVAEHEKLRNLLRLMVRLAHRDMQESRRPSKRERWSNWSAHGVRWDYPPHSGGEHHALCAFCGENLATMGAGSHKIPNALLRRLEFHAYACAMRSLLGPA